MNASSFPDPPPRPRAPPALWRIAEAFMHTLFALFGSPSEIAAQHTLRAEAHRLLAAWVRVGEALMRRLLLIEASACPKPNTRPLLWPARKRVRRLVGFTAEHPEAWRVSFRALVDRAPRAPLGPARALAAPRPRTPRASREHRWSHERFKPVTFHSAWPLAERAEALLRVFNDPGPYARRLARRLHAAPHRAAALLAHPPDAPARVGEADFSRLARAARAARGRFSSA